MSCNKGIQQHIAMFVVVRFDYSSESGERESSIAAWGRDVQKIKTVVRKLFDTVVKNDCDGNYDNHRLEPIANCDLRHAFDKYTSYEIIWSMYELEDNADWTVDIGGCTPELSWGMAESTAC